MLLYTAPLISETQDIAKAQKVEQAFTVFDSRTSKSSLGESPLQATALSLMGENIIVHGRMDSYNESRIMIIALSSNSSWYDSFYPNRGAWGAWEKYENQEHDFAGFNASMGKVRYYSGNRVIAYEGGGVWSRYPEGGTIMVSPPEFHYNGETLTLPIMKVVGNDSIGGSSNVNINVKSSNTPVVLYPNTTRNTNFTNPLNCDKILIYINSEFYDGWAEYAETLTSTHAILDHKNKTAIIEMDTKPPMGTFPLKHSFKIGKLNQSNPEPIYNFSFSFEAVTGDASNFNSVETYVTATAGTKTLNYEIKKTTIEFIEYSDSAVGTNRERWVSTGSPNSTFVIYDDPTNKKKANSTFDLVSDTYPLKYHNKYGAEFSWDEVSPTTMTPNLTIANGDVQSLNNITQHYMKLLSQEGVMTCTWEQKKNKKINEGASTYTLIYDGGEGYLTYLHITSNELEVTLD
ncbi:MAG: hypothetical protein Q8J68_03000 [Methanolobus sp.]|uniref:DUF7289 family protein n=1 Tax=Methanolobus sp. TaxID=1874737 RepID=UPI00272F7C69|nr:hypothetical protein [Methanolobus sp.]MDP2216241.1 hypothetical protein [Methanolobus sp.]